MHSLALERFTLASILFLIMKLFAISVVMSLTLFLRLSSEYVSTGKLDLELF
jgi:hypothetical protein